MTENSGKNQKLWRFQKGKSGNPAGKPKGARHKTTLIAEKLMQDDAEAVVKAVVDAAKGGDMTAAKIILYQIMPARRGSVSTSKKVIVFKDSEAGRAWEAYRLATEGRGWPWIEDVWCFDSKWPPPVGAVA